MLPKKDTPPPCYPDGTASFHTDAGAGGTTSLLLKLDPEQLSSCTACGMCLPHCPTYRITGEEAASPRGRLALMSAVQKSGVADASFAEHMEFCVLCRGCETACPAGVPFGHLMEQTREALAEQPVSKHSSLPLWLRFGYKFLHRQKLLKIAVVLAAIAQRLRLLPKKLNLPTTPLRQGKLQPSAVSDSASDPSNETSNTAKSNTVWLFTGCIMDAVMRDVHLASQQVLEATGANVAFPNSKANCCGSLHRHAGLAKDARKLARRTMSAFPGNGPILVNSAGCGAALKDYGTFLGTEEASQFSSRVKDIHEWLADNLNELPLNPNGLPKAETFQTTSDVATALETVPHQPNEPPPSTVPPRTTFPKPRVAILDPCHLLHAQGVQKEVRKALQPFAEIVELDDQGMCCGAGGAYSLTHPEAATAIRNRKIEAIQRSGATQVATPNPGCLLHLKPPLAKNKIKISHPLEIIRSEMSGGSGI